MTSTEAEVLNEVRSKTIRFGMGGLTWTVNCHGETTNRQLTIWDSHGSVSIDAKEIENLIDVLRANRWPEV